LLRFEHAEKARLLRRHRWTRRTSNHMGIEGSNNEPPNSK
jgi:hypothetical protein